MTSTFEVMLAIAAIAAGDGREVALNVGALRTAVSNGDLAVVADLVKSELRMSKLAK